MAEENLPVFNEFFDYSIPLILVPSMRESIELDLSSFNVLKESQEYFSEHGINYHLEGEILIIETLPLVFGSKPFADGEQFLQWLKKQALCIKQPIPSFAHEILKSKACRYAIKFG